MLQAINDRIKGWLGIAIVILIGLPFALWGIQSYFDDSGPRYAAKVNGVEISANEFERSVAMQRQNLMRKYGGELPIEVKDLRERTLKQLINQRLLENVTFDNGYRVSDGVLSARIRQLFTVDGVFDRVRFESSVTSLGMSIPMYEQTLRNELRVQQMQAAVANTAFATRAEAETLAALKEQTRDITILTFNVEHFSTAKKPTQEEIKQYYETNRQRFMVPEKLKIDYVEIDSESLSNAIEADDAQIQKMYDDYVSSISSREQRKASHILVQPGEDKASALAQIESIKQELAKGADFSTLAKKYSKDTVSAEEGGDLGWVSTGDMVKPFEDSLFAMQQGQVSDVVETQFGYHLIKLDDVRSETPEPLEVKRAEFEDELKADGIASLFYDLSERLASIAYENPDNLDLVVDELALEIKTSEYFSRDAGKGIATDRKVRDVAFSSLVLEQGSNSDIVELSPTHVLVMRLNEHVPATAIPLETVSSRIENILTVQGGHEQTKAAAAQVKQKLEAGESVDSVTSEGIRVEQVVALSRTDNTKVSDPVVLRNAFEITPVSEGKVAVKEVDLLTGDVALVVLNKVNYPQDIPKDKLDLVKSEIVREHAIRDFSSALLAIKERADIDKNTRIIER